MSGLFPLLVVLVVVVVVVLHAPDRYLPFQLRVPVSVAGEVSLFKLVCDSGRSTHARLGDNGYHELARFAMTPCSRNLLQAATCCRYSWGSMISGPEWLAADPRPRPP